MSSSSSSIDERRATTEATMSLSEDFLDLVFEYLPSHALYRSARVSRLWNEVAQRALAKRCLHHVVMAPHVHQRRDFLSQFKLRPDTSLFFCASRPGLRNADNIDYATLYQYHHQYPQMGHTVVLGVEHAMLDTREIKSCYEYNHETDERWQCNGVLGLNLADTKDAILKIAWCDTDEASSLVDARRILEQLRPDEGAGNPVYLMFGGNKHSVGKHVMTMLREQYKDSQPNVWGGTMAAFIKCGDSYPPKDDVQLLSDKRFTKLHGFLGILLQRPRLSAHSTVVRLADDLTTRLAEFKLGLALRRRSLGFVCGPHSHGEVYVYKTVMQAVKRLFPMVTFTAYFNGPLMKYYGCDNKDADGSKPLTHEKTISIMILTWD